MHVELQRQLVNDHLAELRADARRARRAERAAEAGQALSRREWRVLVDALRAR